MLKLIPTLQDHFKEISPQNHVKIVKQNDVKKLMKFQKKKKHFMRIYSKNIYIMKIQLSVIMSMITK